MARVTAIEFTDREIVRVYLAARLSEARLIEDELDRCDVDYLIEVEPYLSGTLLGIREYRGAAFYVIADMAEVCRNRLREKGFKSGMVDDEFE